MQCYSAPVHNVKDCTPNGGLWVYYSDQWSKVLAKELQVEYWEKDKTDSGKKKWLLSKSSKSVYEYKPVEQDSEFIIRQRVHYLKRRFA